ncbi:Retrovirus-related Pol polyprotein from transposon TNT 1-94 [Gossypium australe]|uniref:Retrovirus-related Pol polyprotein from transposon TNT 1-94 n=1 Tax=Gossypium australe TaxID=47621 RepID=A0A5B6WF74_9ROSI|nr:Retrovirus-related Pol polyprotein from transposon TNT 1-94 [Gossypium australe]
MIFKDNKCLIFDPSGCEIISTKIVDRSFAVNWNLATSVVYTNSLDETKLWHRRMGHVGYKSLSQMSPFSTNTAWQAIGKLNLVHADICGSMKTSSLNEYKVLLGVLHEE